MSWHRDLPIRELSSYESSFSFMVSSSKVASFLRYWAVLSEMSHNYLYTTLWRCTYHGLCQPTAISSTLQPTRQYTSRVTTYVLTSFQHIPTPSAWCMYMYVLRLFKAVFQVWSVTQAEERRGRKVWLQPDWTQDQCLETNTNLWATTVMQN